MKESTKRIIEKNMPGRLQIKYKKAIKRGYLDNYSDEWQFSFVGTLLRKYPKATYLLDAFRRILPDNKIPQWKDLTEKNIRLFIDDVNANACPNSVRTYFRILNATINDRLETQKVPFTKYEKLLKKKPSVSQNVYLNEDEIELLYKTRPYTATERYVKRLFLLSCYTGCRHSDVIRLTEANIRDNTIVYVAVKTGKEVRLPLHRNVPGLLTPDGIKGLHETTFNRIIKTLCERALINKEMTLTRRGETTTKPKYEFVSSHTARRSFATNLYLRGADYQQIKNLMGHSDVSQTLKYIVDDRPFSEDISDFFN